MRVSDKVFLKWLESQLSFIQSNLVRNKENEEVEELLEQLEFDIRRLLELNSRTIHIES